MWRFTAVLIAAPLLAHGPLDVALLLDTTTGVPIPFSSRDAGALAPDDRVAVLAFSTKTHLLLPFTSDRVKIGDALRKASWHGHHPQWPARSDQCPKAAVFSALLESTHIFPNDARRRRAVIVVFGAEDDPPPSSINQLRQGLSAAGIRLFAVAVRRYDSSRFRDSRIETPPTIPGPTPPVPTDRAPLALRTLDKLRPLAEASGGQVDSGNVSLSDLFRLARD